MISVGVVILIAWVASGMVTALAMVRRGHRLLPWFGLGVAFGPITAALAVDVTSKEGSVGPEQVWSSPSRPAGATDVLVGTDGSAGSRRTVQTVAQLLGDRIGRLTLATVLDFDAGGGGPAWAGADAAARRLLEEEAAAARDLVTDTILLTGRPADALAVHAVEHGYHLLVIGTRGRGLSKALLGSVAASLAKRTDVPVLLVGDGTGPATAPGATEEMAGAADGG
jgi:nucleotide-binding universal stress UspA family protein